MHFFASLLQCAAAFTKQTVFRTVARASKDYSNWRENGEIEINNIANWKRGKEAKRREKIITIRKRKKEIKKMLSESNHTCQ